MLLVALSGDDGGQMEDLFGEGQVSFDGGEAEGLVAVDAFGENAPCNFLGKDGAGGGLCGGRCEGPGGIVFREKPGASAVAGDFELHGSSRERIDIAISVRKSADETVKNGMIEFRRHDSGTIGGFTYLLLVVPSLGEFAGGIEPVEGCGFAGPAYVERCGGEGVEGFVEVG